MTEKEITIKVLKRFVVAMNAIEEKSNRARMKLEDNTDKFAYYDEDENIAIDYAYKAELILEMLEKPEEQFNMKSNREILKHMMERHVPVFGEKPV